MKSKKITFIGDLMCEPLLLKAALQQNGQYNFDCVFQHTANLFLESDYVVANLETPLAGFSAGYTNGLFSFNTPDEIVDSMKKVGINIVITANNHCLDRGIDGLQRTLTVLDQKKILHTGTFTPGNRYEALYFKLGDIKISLISYTYGTNYADNGILLTQENSDIINLLRPQTERYFKSSGKKASVPMRIFNKAIRFFSEEKRFHIKKALHMTYNVPHKDDNLNISTMAPYIKRMKDDIKCARKKSDYVIFCPHVGGQFNSEPGEITEFIFEKAIEAGCDTIIASHPHVVQKAVINKGIACFYSIGNFSMSPNSVYLLHENFPEYGLAVNMYFLKSGNVNYTFSILKMIEKKKKPLTVYPVDVLYNIIDDDDERKKLKSDVCRIYSIVTGKRLEDNPIRKEYELFVYNFED